jgi:hypothetical protein
VVGFGLGGWDVADAGEESRFYTSRSIQRGYLDGITARQGPLRPISSALNKPMIDSASALS